MAAKKKGRPRKTSATQPVKETKSTAGRRQMMAVLWFAIAIFLGAVLLYPGGNVWLTLHNFFLGVFGVTAYFYPILMGAIAVFYAMDKFSGSITAKMVECTVLVMLIGAAIDIFSTNVEKMSEFPVHLATAFDKGAELKSGGFLGALIGNPIIRLFDKTGAIITIILLIFVFVMIISGTTLIALFKNLAKPVKKIEEHVENSFNELAEQRRTKEKERVNVDIPVDDIPERRPNAAEREDLSDKQKRLVEIYNDAEENGSDGKTTDSKKTRAATESGEKLKSALDTTKNEEKIKLSNEENQKEIAQVEKEISSGIAVSQDTGYKYPPISLLKAGASSGGLDSRSELDATANHLVETLRSFGVETRIVDISRGPTVTRYELQPCAGVKISRITNLADDIALNLATAGVRIEAPIPNKAAVGIEVPNKASSVVGVREIIESPAFTSSKSKLTVAMGRDIGGNVIVTDIAKMPHGLIAGATGSGKSVCINSIIMSLLYKAAPDEVKLLMIDPKVVELGIYNGIPHLLVPVVTDPRKAAGALGWAVGEMEKRYQLFAAHNVRDLAGFNKIAETDPTLDKLPQIVIIIDELADLMMTAPNEVEDSINRIAAKARAAGMHLIIATQRPSVDVVTGVIKANIPTRIAFAVSSQVDSRTILDSAGAEKLLGRGDMLFNPYGASKPSRVQGCYVSDEEVEAVAEYVKADHTNEYDENIMFEIERQAAQDKKQKTGVAEEGSEEGDPMLTQAIEVVVENGQASTSLLQRRLKLGYARAARLIDEMETRGIVGPYEGSKPRQVLITKAQLDQAQAEAAADNDDDYSSDIEE